MMKSLNNHEYNPTKSSKKGGYPVSRCSLLYLRQPMVQICCRSTRSRC